MTAPAGVVLAYVDAWEWECCGDTLSVGDVTEVTHWPFDVGPHAGEWSGPPAGSCDWRLAHHDTSPVPVGRSRVAVRRIYACVDGTPVERPGLFELPGSWPYPEGWILELEPLGPA